ncbi:MAG TPA: hypothetical protein PKA28_15690 [Methylomusa anaerophila]|uniref:TM2 domain protein n=1 Tax=Methylomusa anaerophila TaxID=1930071 RepID=A0A348AHC4_9FIRM|nr:hypothetical protein [Methylomusa anaerophila]BBB90472.1 TM2 domain protein [Methylomusa anaerophila]HML89886.1 hypothetical protein [Methylomusa anaerophila]
MGNLLQNAPRWPRAAISSFQTNLIHFRNPLVTALWSVALPGFGHIFVGSYIKGYLLIIWEIVVNTQSHLNLVILYSFTGRFPEAMEAINPRWLLLYVPFYLFAVWDSYRLAIQLNKLALLAERTEQQLPPVVISAFEINFLDKRSPWGAMLWSLLIPGAGNLYNHRLPTGFILLTVWVCIAYQSHLLEAFTCSLLGDFVQATAVTDPAWLLFLPSIHYFGMYSAYTYTVEYNKLFDYEQARHLRQEYPNRPNKMPF